jgi:Tol biopolymer transport system component
MNRWNILLGGGGLLVLILLGVVGFFVLRLLFQPATVELTDKHSGLAFLSDRDDGYWGIYVLDSDGEIRRLSPLYDGDIDEPCDESTRGSEHCMFDYFPSYAFDGEMLNFLTNREDLNMGPGQVRLDGSDFAALDVVGALASVALDERFDWDPNWASNGWLGWSKIETLNLEIYVAEPGGGNERRITRDGINGPRDWFLAWSPDGQSFVFSSDREGTEDVYRVDVADLQSAENIDDIPIMQLTDNPVDDIRAVWSLDGETIMFISDLNDALLDGQVQLFLMNPDGSDQRPLGDDTFEGGAVYSADGTQAVYISNESGTWNLYLLDVESGDIQQLTDDAGNDLFPVWGPIPVTDSN